MFRVWASQTIGIGLSALFLSLGLPSAMHGAETPGEVVPEGDVRLSVGIYGVVFYYSPLPKMDPRATAEALAKECFPGISFATDSSRKPPYLFFEEEAAPLTHYRVPDANYFRFAGRGLTAEDISGIQKTTRATVLLLVVPKEEVWTQGRKFTELAWKFAETTGAVIWDSATRECFSREEWREKRLESWPKDGFPDLRNQITVHLYRSDDTTQYLRAITLGMEKFALPDVVIERLLGSDNRPAGNLINLVCQSLAEHPQLKNGGKEAFRLDRLAAGEFRETMTSSLEDNATGEILLKLVHGNPVEGDPDNDLIEIRFDHGEGKTEDERRLSLLAKLWGATDAIVSVNHTEEILEASERARVKLLGIKKEFDKGLPPGSRLLVKGPFARDDEGDEWMWVEVMKWSPKGVIEGVLQNDPFYISKLKAGAPVRVKVSEVFDYILYRGDGTTEGNETGEFMSKQGGEVKKK